MRVAEPNERLQALAAAFQENLFDFVTKLLACSYSRRAHHPLLQLKVWLAMLAHGDAPWQTISRSTWSTRLAGPGC